ncbi:MAG: phosphoadenosine phosphosulfate reductase domain-containing protein [Candidatus Heimdallarchaeaceae archaeon]
MREEDRLRFLLLNEDSCYLENLLFSQRFLDSLFSNKNNRIYAAISGGKDSMVMLDLTLQSWQRNPEQTLYIWHWDYGEKLIPRKIEREIIGNIHQLINKYQFPIKNFLVDKRTKTHSSRDDSATGYRQFFVTLKKIIIEHGFTHALIGLRRDESCGRRLFLREKITHSRKIASSKHISDCYPLASFSARDVWTYIVTNAIPYPCFYDHLAKVQHYEDIRFVTFFDHEFVNINQTDDFFFWREKH